MQWKQTIKDIRLIIPRYVNFNFLAKGLWIVSPPYLYIVYQGNTSHVIFWPNSIAWLPLLLEISAIYTFAIVYFPGLGIIQKVYTLNLAICHTLPLLVCFPTFQEDPPPPPLVTFHVHFSSPPPHTHTHTHTQTNTLKNLLISEFW